MFDLPVTSGTRKTDKTVSHSSTALADSLMKFGCAYFFDLM